MLYATVSCCKCCHIRLGPCCIRCPTGNCYQHLLFSLHINDITAVIDKNSAEVDIAPAFGEITTACNVGQTKKGHGACLKSGQLVYARFHTHSHRYCREMYFNSRHDIKFGQNQWSVN